MERCLSSSSIPQAVIRPAKRSLVKSSKSDGERSHGGHQIHWEHHCQPKKLRLHKFNFSFDDFTSERGCMVSPSTRQNSQIELTRVSSQDDLWTSIKSNYTFLMADDLIEECKETREELHLLHLPSLPSYSTPSSSNILTLSEFKDQFNNLHDRLHTIHESEVKEPIDEKKIEELFAEYHLLREQAEVLKLMNPELTEDIAKRINILSNKWELLEKIFYPQKKKELDSAVKNLSNQMRDLRKWLREVEEKLRRNKINHECTLEEMNSIFNCQQILQREIEGRGKELTSLVRQCNSLEGTTVADSKRLRRAAIHLERSWHNIWLRSLEKQFLTEQQLQHHQNNENKSQESSDIDSDEGPLNKHRRLTLDHWTSVKPARNMDKTPCNRIGINAIDILQKSPTRDIGVLCTEKIPVNDKCVMVGTTGIAALKAEYGDDFTNFEIIQDVGYSSESSTHLSSDDSLGIGGDRYYNIRVYKYLDDKPINISLKEEIENACNNAFRSLSSSVDSSSGGTSFNDSGLGNTDLPAGEDASEASKEHSPIPEKVDCHGEDSSSEEAGLLGDESDYLETVLASCTNFNNDIDRKDHNIPDELPFSLSGIDSDDAGYNFHERMAFTKPAQVFYKMISVESDNGEYELREIDSQSAPVITLSDKTAENTTHKQKQESHKCSQSDFDIDFSFSIPTKHQKLRSSTPMRKSYYASNLFENSKQHNLKRKRASDSTASAPGWCTSALTPNQVRSWLKRCSVYDQQAARNYSKRSLFHAASAKKNQDCNGNSRYISVQEEFSSCDASGEYTSSSADEGNMLSSSTALEDSMYSKEGLDTYSMEGSVETVIRNLSSSIQTNSDTLELFSSVNLSNHGSPQNRDRKMKRMTSYDHKDYRLSTVSCEELRVIASKSSERNLKTSRAFGFSKENDISSEVDEAKIFSFEHKPRLSKSLPNVLYHRSESSTEDASGFTSHQDTCKSQCSLHQSRKSCSSVSYNFSSSSEHGKRKKRKKKSSGSCRSSRSALNGSDSNRQRTRTLTNSLAEIESRSRNISQQSFLESSENNFFSDDDGSLSEVKVSRTNELVRKNLTEDFILTLDDSCNECVNSEILSPVESDVVLTHLEEQSTVSDQVWDSYQEMPYLSEGYSEATVDEDAVRKLTEFGDDYGSAIGHSLRFKDSSKCILNKSDNSRSPRKASKVSLFSHDPVYSLSNESDSDSEDLHHVIKEAKKALFFARTLLKKGQSGDFFTSAEHAELLATCGTHLNCLLTICEHLESGGNENNFSNDDLQKLYHLINEWKTLQKSVEMMNEGEEYTKQKFIRAQKNIDEFFQKMSELETFSAIHYEQFDTWDSLKEKVLKLQTVMSTLLDTKERLLAVNLEVHRFMTDHGHDIEYKDCTLKENVTELYQRWDDVYENNQTQLTTLEVILTKWKTYNDKIRALRYNLKFVEENSRSFSRDEKYFTNDDEFKCLRKSLDDVKKDAILLKEFLKGGATWRNIDLELEDLVERINKYTRTQRESRRDDYPLSLQEDPDDQFEDAMQLLESGCSRPLTSDKSQNQTDSKKDPDWSPKRKPSRFWRMIRIAVPVQFALVFLYCIACCLEPSCCDMLNNFNFSLSPHLRYWRGPPPA